ncbi:hypothetical protein HBI24_071750 [Parastagonospora nodorum]|nr:hypothetical protein HBI24_071750 [Parastagonospora nodorum]
MRSISINNDLLRHKILNRYIFAIMTLLICNAMTLTSDEYKILYAEVKREIRERAILSCCKVQRLIVAYVQLRT